MPFDEKIDEVIREKRREIVEGFSYHYAGQDQVYLCGCYDGFTDKDITTSAEKSLWQARGYWESYLMGYADGKGDRQLLLENNDSKA